MKIVIEILSFSLILNQIPISVQNNPKVLLSVCDYIQLTGYCTPVSHNIKTTDRPCDRLHLQMAAVVLVAPPPPKHTHTHTHTDIRKAVLMLWLIIVLGYWKYMVTELLNVANKYDKLIVSGERIIESCFYCQELHLTH